MKILVVIFMLFSTASLLAQNQFDFDSDTFRLKLNSKNTINSTNTFNLDPGISVLFSNSMKVQANEWKRTNSLLVSLENFALLTRNEIVNDQSGVIVNLQHLGKTFLRDDSEAYRNDLSRFLPQVPDANLLCPIVY